MIRQRSKRYHTPFSPTSPWNSKLSDDAPLDPRSETYVASFRRQFTDNYGTVGINTSKFTPPVFVVERDQQPSIVGWNDCQKKEA